MCLLIRCHSHFDVKKSDERETGEVDRLLSLFIRAGVGSRWSKTVRVVSIGKLFPHPWESKLSMGHDPTVKSRLLTRPSVKTHSFVKSYTLVRRTLTVFFLSYISPALISISFFVFFCFLGFFWVYKYSHT